MWKSRECRISRDTLNMGPQTSGSIQNRFPDLNFANLKLLETSIVSTTVGHFIDEDIFIVF